MRLTRNQKRKLRSIIITMANVWEYIKIIAVVVFAMLTGAACYHQYLMAHKEPAGEPYRPEDQWRIRYEEMSVEYEALMELMAERETEAPELHQEFIVQWDDELQLMAICIEAEAGNQSIEGKRMVADVILNRVRDKDFPDTITEVITQPYQFSSYWDGNMASIEEPSEETIRVVLMELEEVGWPGLFYFTAEGYSKYGTPWKKVGDHYFSTK